MTLKNDTTRPVAIILCGLSFSGKSTLARHLQKKLRYTILAEDDINAERNLGIEGEHIDDKEWNITFDILAEKMHKTLDQKSSVIIDAMNHTPEQRERLWNCTKNFTATSVFIFVEVDPDLAEQRWQENEKNPSRAKVFEADFKRANSFFEHPSAEEVSAFDHVLHYPVQANFPAWFAENKAMFT